MGGAARRLAPQRAALSGGVGVESHLVGGVADGVSMVPHAAQLRSGAACRLRIGTVARKPAARPGIGVAVSRGGPRRLPGARRIAAPHSRHAMIRAALARAARFVARLWAPAQSEPATPP